MLNIFKFINILALALFITKSVYTVGGAFSVSSSGIYDFFTQAFQSIPLASPQFASLYHEYHFEDLQTEEN